MKYLFSQILIFFGYVLSAENLEENIQQPKQYAIYLTTGSEAHSFQDSPWGGCHITLAGFHHKHGNQDLLNKLPQIIKHGKNRHGWTPKFFKLQRCKKNWSIVFYSITLNKIAKRLSKNGFKKIKGPKFGTSHFHMALPHLKDQQEAEEFARKLKTTEWFVTKVELVPSDSLFPQVRWLEYFRL